jgi:Stage II sporulation protein E (SpoIIE)
VQKVLLPEAIRKIRCFRVECEYRPAQEVGGDFFQVLDTHHGGVLVAIGDISGKGVQAAMLVALIVGALRSFAEETEYPQTILIRLNRRLCGRMQGGLATCLCALIASDGATTIANAGRLAPWLDGQEIEVPHDLPLGIPKMWSTQPVICGFRKTAYLRLSPTGLSRPETGRKNYSALIARGDWARGRQRDRFRSAKSMNNAVNIPNLSARRTFPSRESDSVQF